MVPQVLEALRVRNVVLHAEPGAGKSTLLPLKILQNSSFDKKIIMLEPRRLAARSVAERLSEQLAEPLGGQIGFAYARQHRRVKRDPA